MHGYLDKLMVKKLQQTDMFILRVYYLCGLEDIPTTTIKVKENTSYFYFIFTIPTRIVMVAVVAAVISLRPISNYIIVGHG